MDDTGAPKKKLIEVGLPLEAINRESAREKSIRHGHPSTLHLWWARRPLATARAVLFAQLVDDPSAHPELFPTVSEQDRERKRLHNLIEELVKWESSNRQDLLEQAQAEIRKSNNGEMPAILDPFAGGGTIPLEAQRLGCEAHASDLNPVAVLINKALIEIPPKFANRPPVHPEAEKRTSWKGAQGLAEDIRQYGKMLRDMAWEKVGHLYPTVTDEQGIERTVIAWIWARTVKSPNPANPIEVPLVRSWWLSKKKGKEAWIKPTVQNGSISYTVVHNNYGPNKDEDGTIGRSGGRGVSDDTPISLDYIREQGKRFSYGSDLISIIADSEAGRLYLNPGNNTVAEIVRECPEDIRSRLLPQNPRWFSPPLYGMTTWESLFTNRQLTTITTLCALVEKVRLEVLRDAIATGIESGDTLDKGGSEAVAYADAIEVYLTLAISRMTDYSSNLCSWHSGRETIRNVFSRQAIPMVWDYAESNPFSDSSGNYLGQVEWIAKVIENVPAKPISTAQQENASTRSYLGLAVSTDPPYYDNIGYSDLSDYFYNWQRLALADILPSLFETMLTPKTEELVANPYRNDGKVGAEEFFVSGFNEVFRRIRKTANIDIPLTVYYAYKQQDTSTEGNSSTGWHTLLDGLIKTGWEITGTWPVRSELSNRMLSHGTNALASSIVLACRPRPENAATITRRAFISTLKQELPESLRAMMQAGIAPVDLAQAAIGPGISVFSRYARVREADGTDMSVRDALMLINQTLDEVLDEQETDFDPDTRFAVKWYKSYGWDKAESGVADQLSRSTDTSIAQLERGGIFEARGGKARLISPPELAGEWDVEKDDSVSIWEAVVRLSAIMSTAGAERVAALLPLVQTRVDLDAVKELGFFLFHEAEKQGNTEDALVFNSLISSWGDLSAQSSTAARAAQLEQAQGKLDFS